MCTVLLPVLGAGVETAKNLILSNVGAVMVWDPEPTELRDLGANFYLTEAHARDGSPRAEVGRPESTLAVQPFSLPQGN